mmetsp:Transcript_22309/g.53521  ORF Transcript_22309/g.53521 Transcript_22309/m.53521 type:complete len:604 (+) Transcript_22309:86-1897(+)
MGGDTPHTSERTPLLGGFSVVTTEAPPVRNTPADGAAVGYTLRESYDKIGLVEDAFEGQEEVRCWGQEDVAYSVLARLPAIHTYTTLAFFLYFGHVWLLMQRPDIAVWLIGTFLAYAFVRFWALWLSAFHGLSLLLRHDSRDPHYWQAQRRPLGAPDFYSVWHAVIIPNYKEPIGKLRQTLDTIASQSIAKNIVVCMGMEARDPNAVLVAEALQTEYAHRLGGFCYSLHPIVLGEVPGKSSNENWAARCVSKHLVEQLRINPDSVVLTTCDADTFFHPNHFAYVSHAFLSDGDARYHRFYMGVTNFMPNVNDIPGVCSARFTVLTIGRMAEMGSPVTTPFPLAIYSISLRLAQRAHFWDPKVIPEDWHMYFRCMYADQGQVGCTRLYVTIGTEAVVGKDYLDTIKETYDQSVRWQWGAIDIGYLITQTFSRPDVPIWQRVKLLYAAYDHHLLSVVMVVGLMAAPWLYGKIPVLLDLDIWTGAETIVRLGSIMIWIWIVHMSCHFTFMCYTDHVLRNDLLRNREHFDTEGVNGPYRWATLALYPLADVFLFIVPTIHAHTKMFFNSSFNYVPSAKQGVRCPTPCGGGDLGVDDSAEVHVKSSAI